MSNSHSNLKKAEGTIDAMDVGLQDSEALLEKIRDKVPGFELENKPVPLTGGLLNFVWRLNGAAGSHPQSLIAKWAPPYIASSPEIQLDPERISFEAKALAAFSQGGTLSFLSSDRIRLPEPYFQDDQNHLLVMEDVCQCPDLSAWIQEKHDKSEAELIGKNLGNFIGNLHLFSSTHPELAVDFDNRKIQRTRLEVLYENVGSYAMRAGLSNAVEIGQIAVKYGRLLQRAGKVLIMGDLWLPSVFVSGENLRIIDWEFTHYGYPSQDIGHLTAHLWMHAHHAITHAGKQNSRVILSGFLEGYRAALGKEFFNIFGTEGIRQSSIHFGCEILARTVGLFQNGFLYEGLETTHPIIQEAVENAARHIMEPLKAETFEELNWRSNT